LLPRGNPRFGGPEVLDFAKECGTLEIRFDVTLMQRHRASAAFEDRPHRRAAVAESDDDTRPLFEFAATLDSKRRQPEPGAYPQVRIAGIFFHRGIADRHQLSSASLPCCRLTNLS
jgi:hypothetical protein